MVTESINRVLKLRGNVIDIIAVLFLVAGLFHSAASSAAIFNEILASEIEYVRVDNRAGFEGFYVKFTKDVPGDGACSPQDFAYIRTTNPLAKEMYSTLLAGISLGKTFTIISGGCDAKGNVISAIAMQL